MSHTAEPPSWVFNRNDDSRGIPRQLSKGLSTRVFVGQHSMLSVVRIEARSRGQIHSHPEEQWGVLLEGECVRVQDGLEVAMRPGDFWHTPANTPHGLYTKEKSAVVLDIFSPARPEYRRQGEGFGGARERD